MWRIFEGRIFLVRVAMVAAAMMLVLWSIAVLYAVDNPAEGTGGGGRWQRQVVYAGVGIVAFLVVNIIDYRDLGPLSYWIYGVMLVLLAYLLVDKVFDVPFVEPIKGARRWIQLGGIAQIQPSEFCKLAYIMALAYYLRFRSNYRRFWGLLGPFALTLLAMVLILAEPDLGTVILMMPILFAMLFVAGARVRHLVIIVAMAGVVSPFMWHFMNEYQRMRISSTLLQNEWVMEQAHKHKTLAEILVGEPRYLRTWEDNQGYQLKQSKLAIASGGIGGFGWRRGPFLKYNYLPDRHNDFIFALIAHQWGFVGCLGLLLLYAVIVFCGIEIAAHNTDPFARLTAVGIIAMFAIQVIVNVSMTIGLMPITGITLPMVSYGGSSLMVNMVSIGLLHNIGRKRPFSVARRSFEYDNEQ